MAALFHLEYDADPFEDIIAEASDTKLQELLRICLKFGEDEKAALVMKEIRRRQELNQQN